MKKLLLVALLSLSVATGFSTIISKDEQVKDMENGKTYIVEVYEPTGKDLKGKFFVHCLSDYRYMIKVHISPRRSTKIYEFLKNYLPEDGSGQIDGKNTIKINSLSMEVTLSQPIEKFMSIQKEGFKIKPFKHCCCKCCCHKPVQPEQPAPAQE